MDKSKKKEPARLVVELTSREKLKALHAHAKKDPDSRSTAEWARKILFREAGI